MRDALQAVRLLGECSRALISSPDETTFLGAVCRVLVEAGGYRLAWIGYAEDDERRTVRPVAQAGFEDGYLEAVQISWADTSRGRGPTGTAIRTGQPAICRDIVHDPHFAPWRNEAIRRGYASSMACPLIAQGVTLGALNVYAAAPDAFDGFELHLLTQLADDVAAGIVVQRGAEERRQVERALREQRERFRIVVEQAPVGIYIIEDERLVYVNPRFAEIFGRTAEEVLGLADPLTELVAPADRPRIAANVERRLSVAESFHYTFSGRRKDGAIRTLEVRGASSLVEGRPFVIGAVLDVTAAQRTGPPGASS